MKRVLYSLLALCLLLSGAVAEPNVQLAAGGFGAGNNLTGFWQKKRDAAAVASITFLQCATDANDLTNYSFASQNTGAESADRHTIVVVNSEDSATNFSTSSMTIGGDAASEAADSISAGTGSTTNTSIYIMANPTGTSETIAVSMSEAITGMGICVFQANNLASATAFATLTDFDTASAALTLNINTQADGIGVGGCNSGTNGQTATWAGLTESGSETSVGTELTMSVADAETATASTPLTVTCDFGGSQDSTGAAASFK